MSERLFFIAVLPNETIQREVTDFKHYLAEHFGARHALKSPPHLTLFPPFQWRSAHVGVLEQALADFAAQATSFFVDLQHFSSFPPRVLFVAIVKNEPLESLQTQLEMHLQTVLSLKNDRSHPGFHPHMTIAHKDLQPDWYPAAWSYFSQQTYERRFLVPSITLLEHQRGRWEVYKDFAFDS